ncbi:MAG TPA: prolyl oligopeptidase family serine peptidase [Chloroflexota bacterium]|nr:prolyl oligopeptidase family serine peptidase [Chloroflexota bacterium]
MKQETPPRFDYPPAPQGDVVDDYHGTRVPDPYRWLEDADAPETVRWVEAQNALTSSFLQAGALPGEAPGSLREQLKSRLTRLWDYPRYGVPQKEGGYYFFWKNDGLQNQPVLYTQPSLEDEPRLVLDPNTFSEDGTAAVTGHSFTRDGRRLTYGLSRSGSDWQELHVIEPLTGKTYPDVIRRCKFAGVAWKADGSGFYYNRFPDEGTVPPEDESNYQRVCWHTLGTTQDEDRLVYERPDAKELGFTPRLTDDGAYLVLHVWRGTEPQNRFYYRPTAAGEGADFVRLLDEADARYDFVDNVGSTFYFSTDLDAPRGRIVAIDVEHPEVDDPGDAAEATRPRAKRWREIVAQGDDPIDHVAMVNGHLVVVYLHHVHHRIHLYTLDGQFVREIPLPGLGAVAGLTGRNEDTELFLGFTSFLYPLSILRYDFTTAQLHTVRTPELDFDPSPYETKQVFYHSKDGTRVPMFITQRKDIVLDGTNPTLLYGYGGFNISLTPSFAVQRLIWLEQGGVLAVANLRGGSEYGEAWHQAGILERKQNVFDDFIAGAEWLIAQGYTSRERLAIQGGSNGGLLVAACVTQRPDLFGAVLCQVPVADMLRYHRFTVGRYWTTDFGNAEADPEHFKFLYAYSPVHNARPGTVYPPILITSADTDDRVVSAHAKKLAAGLQAAQAGEAPILLRVETKAGHGAGKPTAKVIEEQADLYAFLFQVLRIPYTAPVS